MFRISLAFLLLAGLLAGVSMAGSAYFTDQAVVSNNVFSTGNIKIGATPVPVSLSLAKMAPGDKVTGKITVANTADVDFGYTMATSTTPPDSVLAAALLMEVKTGVSNCTTNAGFSADGLTIAGPSALNNSIGFTSGISRTLAGSVSGTAGSEDLCFQVRLPETNADQNSVKGLTATTTITFTAISKPHYP